MNPIGSPPRRPLPAHLASGVIGGLVVLALGAILLGTGVIDTGGTKTVVRESVVSRPAADRSGSTRTVTDIYRSVGPGVVFIQARGVTDTSPFGLPGQQGVATGSGFVIDKDGYVLTNDHVVEGSSDVSVRFKENGPAVNAQVKGSDPSSDLALLKIDPGKAKLDPVPLGSSKKVAVGDPAIAIGNPFGLQRTVTTGIVSAVQREINAPNDFTIRGAIQTDASVNPGNSGGPLLNGDGRVIGINSQIATGGGSGSVGIAFAVPIDLAKKVLPELKRKGKVERAFIGVTTTRVTKRLANDLNLPVKKGALIVDVRRGSPADKAGLRAGHTQTTEGLRIGGDLIVRLDDKGIDSPEGLVSGISGKKPGDEVTLTYYRGRDRKTTKVKLGQRPAGSTSSSPDQGGGGVLPFP
ncbi:MAG: S1C family serine protease [Thermoleophilaceae bacterium]